MGNNHINVIKIVSYLYREYGPDTKLCKHLHAMGNNHINVIKIVSYPYRGYGPDTKLCKLQLLIKFESKL